jgi:diguanylate cyclase (GGDEF)-like protein
METLLSNDGTSATEALQRLTVRPMVENAARPLVLVVDDEALSVKHISKLLKSRGYDVICAGSGADALEMLNAHEPRLILSDWKMRGMDGLEFCKQVRNRPGLIRPHFIMITGLSEKSHLVEAFDAGADDFLAKPFDDSELFARLRSGLRVVESEEQLARRNREFQQINVHLAELNQRLEMLAVTDDLTGLLNRRFALWRLEELWQLSVRYGRPLTVAIVDIDHFKQINDRFGHDAGDAVLRQVAALMRVKTRTTDTVCRTGGEEFLIIFPNETAEEGRILCSRLRVAMDEMTFGSGRTEGEKIRATISIGVATRKPETRDVAALLKSADSALYEAKRAGRNRVTVYGDLSDQTRSAG